MDFAIERRGTDYWASDGREAPFFIGRRLRYQGRVGLGTAFPGCPSPPIRYDAAAYRTRFGLWAELIAPTIACEGGSFTALNSYDRAGFSFGIGQFAAHVPEGDFVCFLRAMLGLPEARLYFPTLILHDGRVAEVRPKAAILPLEAAGSTRALRAWLNPGPTDIEPVEAQAAARLIHWTLHQANARAAQVAQMIAGFRRAITAAARHVPGRMLTGAEASVIGDLVHHGRAGGFLWQRVAAALGDAEPLARLLEIGGARWVSRVDVLRAEIVARTRLGRHVWDPERKDFVLAS